jgi:mannose-6-phosphate isomerase-like protein (cupin superfamily)
MSTDTRVRFSFDDNLSFEGVTAHGGSRPILTRRVLSASESGSCNFIDLTIVPPGSDIGVHTHTDDNEEIYVIVSGSGTMFVDGRRFAVATGDVIVNRPGGTHGFWNTSGSEVRLVVIEVPVRSKTAPHNNEGK